MRKSISALMRAAVDRVSLCMVVLPTLDLLVSKTHQFLDSPILHPMHRWREISGLRRLQAGQLAGGAKFFPLGISPTKLIQAACFVSPEEDLLSASICSCRRLACRFGTGIVISSIP